MRCNRACGNVNISLVLPKLAMVIGYDHETYWARKESLNYCALVQHDFLGCPRCMKLPQTLFVENFITQPQFLLWPLLKLPLIITERPRDAKSGDPCIRISESPRYQTEKRILYSCVSPEIVNNNALK